MAKDSRNIYTNGAEIRLHNKRFGFIEKEGTIICNFHFADSEPNKPAVAHCCIRGKIRATKISLSADAMDHLVMAYLRYKKHILTIAV
jgi:hypothetical protein